MRRWYGRHAVLVTVLALAVAVVGPIPSAGAQRDCYPDGCPPPTGPPPRDEVSCQLDRRNGPPGTSVEATVRNGGGSTSVRLLFDGDEVAIAAAPPPGDVRMTFEVPDDARRGRNSVVAVGDTYSVNCGTGFSVTGGGGPPSNADVEGDNASRGRGAGNGGDGSGEAAVLSGEVRAPAASGGSGALPFTGTEPLLLVVVGLGLLGIGLAVRQVLRRRSVP